MKKTVVAMVAAGAILPLFAKIELGAPFTDGAVLQRGMPVNVWGFAAPSARVAVSFGEASAAGVADEHGKWRVKLPKMEADETPRTLVAECGGEDRKSTRLNSSHAKI